jgi:butyrate kinase
VSGFRIVASTSEISTYQNILEKYQLRKSMVRKILTNGRKDLNCLILES